jgi:hypothetical protein
MMTSQLAHGTSNKIKRHLALSAIALVSAFSMPAAAASVQGVPAQVEYGSVLMVQFNSINYVAQATAPGCSIPANSADTIKIWVNLAQAALLSNKNLTIYFSTCNSTNYIRDLVLIK